MVCMLGTLGSVWTQGENSDYMQSVTHKVCVTTATFTPWFSLACLESSVVTVQFYCKFCNFVLNCEVPPPPAIFFPTVWLKQTVYALYYVPSRQLWIQKSLPVCHGWCGLLAGLPRSAALCFMTRALLTLRRDAQTLQDTQKCHCVWCVGTVTPSLRPGTLPSPAESAAAPRAYSGNSFVFITN